MLDAILISLMGLALLGLTGLTFSFLVASFREGEERATLFAAIQFLLFFGGLVLFTLGYANGFFETGLGRTLLILMLAGTGAGTWLLFGRRGENPKALQGTAGLIVGEVERVDERETVFARDLLQSGTDAYKEVYEKHPEWEERDAKRRVMGGPVGEMGLIDKPNGDANNSAGIASILMPTHLAAPDWASYGS